MDLLRDVHRADWLIERAGAFGTVGGVVGGGFSGHARIAHPDIEGQLDPALLAALTEHLARARSTPDDLVAGVWEGHAAIVGSSAVDHSPQLLWPAGHEWALATEIDLDATFVAGAPALVDAILGDDQFDAVAVRETDDLG